MIASPFSLTVDHPSASLVVASFRGREALNRLFHFDIRVTLAASEAPGFASSVLLAGATLSLSIDETSTRRVHGIISAAQAVGTTGSGRATFELRLAPRLHLLKLRRTSRIFQDLDAREIIDRVLDLRSLERQWHLHEDPPKRTYCVQHQETDYAFITRLCAEEGFFFGFEHPTDATTDILVIV